MENNSIKTYFISDKKRVARAALLVIADIFAVTIATFGALWVRLEFSFEALVHDAFFQSTLILLPINIALLIILFLIFKLYTSVWRYASANELLKIVGAVFVATLLQFVVTKIFHLGVPKSYYLFYLVIVGTLTVAVRFSYRFLRIVRNRAASIKSGAECRNVLIIGAGAAGNEIAKEIETTKYLTLKVKAFIDDGEGCQGKNLRGIPIVGNRDKIVDAAEHYNIDLIIIAMPSANKKTISEIVSICKETGCELQIVPGVYQLINGEVSVSQLREVNIEDLLGREPVRTNDDEVAGYVSGKVVVVTGGGGSIGSELCRQVARHNPKQLIIVDIYENNAYDIQQELKKKYPELDLVVLIASVRNTLRINQIFEEYKPNIVYHAAAHKHVPLMEDSPGEAIKNNVFGTYKTAMAASKNGVERFVLVSTDKAVNPTNIMGASKRLCEMVIQMMNTKSDTEFVAVRFGNVLGSNGSVIPLFKKQIAEGGPVTVTDPNIIRYFMTIPEAVSLILQAGAYAKGGEIFVLDMGQPVKIVDLAENLIKLSGYRVGEDIEIVFTGLRPGEKMYEEMLMNEEGLQKTDNELIHIGKPIEMDYDKFISQLDVLDEISRNRPWEIKKAVSEVVTTYKYMNE